MKILFTIVFFIFSFISIAQTTTFDFLLSGNKNDYIKDICEADNNDIYFVGYESKYPDYRIKTSSLIGKINKYGTLVDTVVLGYPDMMFSFNNILPTDSNHFIIIGYLADTTGQRQNISIVLTKIDSVLNVIEQITYKLPPEYKFLSQYSQKGFDNNILTIGAFWPNSDQVRSVIYRTDGNLDSIKAKYFHDSTFFYYRLKELKDHSLWVLPLFKFNYIVIDSTWSDVTNYDMPVFLNADYGFKWDTDSSFYLVGEYFPVPPAEDNKDIGIIRQFHRTDTTGFLFKTWGLKDTLDLPAGTNALDFRTKDSIFIGGTTNTWATYYGTWPTWYFVIQTDSMLNVRWERFYGGDAYYLMQKIIATNDGGCLIAGTRYDYQNATEEELDIHILKLNNEGLLVGEQNHNDIQVSEALVLPNPGTDHLIVRIAAQYPESIFELYDMNSRQVLTKEIYGKWDNINTWFLKPGTYIYRIHNSKGLFESGKWVKQ